MRREKNNKTKRNNLKWIINITIGTIIICGNVTLLSDALLKKVNMIVAFIILIVIVFIGIFFDMLGIAVTAAGETSFHAMAAKKINEAKIAVYLIRNADKVSNFCNDVIGDICGIVSGSVGVLISQKISVLNDNYNMTVISAFIGATIASVTIAGKAVGKIIAINNCDLIIYKVSKILYYFKRIISKEDK